MLIKCYDVGIPFTFISVLMQTLIMLCRGLCSLYSVSAHMHIISIELFEIGLLQRINERGLAIFLNSSGCKSWRWWVLTLCSVHGKEHGWRVSSLRCGCWKDSLFPIELPHSFVKHHFTIYVLAHLWTFSSVPLNYLSILSPIPHHFVLPFKNNFSYSRPSAISHQF